MVGAVLAACIGSAVRRLDPLRACATACSPARYHRAVDGAAHREASARRAVPGPGGMSRLQVTLLVVPLAAVLLVAAWLMTGSSPRPVDAGVASSPPPLALPSDTDERSVVALAAARLAAGDLQAARAGFADAVAESPDDVAAQVGLVLTQWRGAGPLAVERDLTQLAREYPESPLVALHLGLVRTLLGENRAARAALADAVRLGRADGDATGLRMARLADDLLHHRAFRGYLPVLVSPAEVPPADRAALRALLRDVERDDRDAARRRAIGLARSHSAAAQVAAVAATFDKDEPQAAAERLAALAGDRSSTAAERSLARLHQALALLWSGEPRADGCRLLRLVATQPGTGRAGTLARPIRDELCG